MAYVTKFDPVKIPYFTKNERLDYYPAGTKLYTKSNNCKMPKHIRLSVKKFEELTKDMDCTFTSAKTLYYQAPYTELAEPIQHYIYKNYKKKKEK